MIKEDIAEVLRREVKTVINRHVDAKVNAGVEEIASSETLEESVARLVEENLYLVRAELKGEPPEGPQFPDLIDFVTKFICPVYGTAEGARPNWTEEWHTHPEANTRLMALWDCFEMMRLNNRKTFLEPFLRTHCDYHMSQLMKPGGVFEACKTRNSPSVPLPSNAQREKQS